MDKVLRRLIVATLTAGTVLKDVGGDRVLPVRVCDVDVSCCGLLLNTTEPEMSAESIKDSLAVLTWCGSICYAL